MDFSVLTKFIQFYIGTKVFIDYPLGIGLAGFEGHALKFFPEVANLHLSDIVLTTATHNQFLNTAIYYGIPGFGLLLYLCRILFRSLKRMRMSYADNYLRGISIGLTGTFIAYIVNSSFHNAGLFLGDPLNWYFIGLVPIISKLHSRNNKEVTK